LFDEGKSGLPRQMESHEDPDLPQSTRVPVVLAARRPKRQEQTKTDKQSQKTKQPFEGSLTREL